MNSLTVKVPGWYDQSDWGPIASAGWLKLKIANDDRMSLIDGAPLHIH